MKEQDYDRLLKINTCDEQLGFPQSFHYNRYEPTPYSGLEELFKHYQLSQKDRVVDIGCGMGRLNFYIHHRFRSTVVGVEMDEEFYKIALRNRENYLQRHSKGKNKIHFEHVLAQDYHIHPNDNRFYFFNPFSSQIFIKVVNQILISIENDYREVELILYYPSEEYTYFLDQQSPFELKKEVQLSNKYKYNPFEKFLIYRFG